MSEYPEHDKLSAIKDESQAIGEFLDIFLPEKGIVLAEYDEETHRLWPIRERIQSLLAEFFGVDQNKLEEEKRAMLVVQKGNK